MTVEGCSSMHTQAEGKSALLNWTPSELKGRQDYKTNK